jgi:putative membrane protein
MKQYLTTDYQNRLWPAIKAIEQQANAEVTLVFRAHSGDYAAIPLLWGIGAAWWSFTLLMYAPLYFENWLVYYLPMLAFALGYAIGHIPGVKRRCVRSALQAKQADIMARAVFQKGGLQHTRCKTALLIYCSLLERKVVLLADRGLECSVPQAEWQGLREVFAQVFYDAQPQQRLLEALAQTAAVLAAHVPAQGERLNELPEFLDIDL